MNWTDIEENVIIILAGFAAGLLLLIDSENQHKKTSPYTFGAYILVMIGIVNFVILFYKVIKFYLL